MNQACTEIPLQLEALRDAQRQAPVATIAVRKDRLDRLAKMVSAYADEFCVTLDEDFGGRPRAISLMNDVIATLGSIRYARGKVGTWMRPERRGGVFPFNLFGARVEVRHEPKGVVGILGTWNVPLFTTIAPLSFVLAGGNRAMLKPSEYTPRTAGLLRRAVAAYFPPDELAVVTGGAEVSRQFSALPFDHLVLTGSTGTGRAVMRAAAENLTPVTLELGGKSPVIIGRSADLDEAARKIVTGKLMNGGQVCVAPDTIHVPREMLEVFIAAVRNVYRQSCPKARGTSDLTALLDQRQLSRLTGYLDEIATLGGRIEVCGDTVTADPWRQPLRLVIAPPCEARITREEIFGPILQVETYEKIETVIATIAAGDAPLALYYFGRDRGEETRVLAGTRSGGVTINDVMLHVAAHDAPFGGVGASGIGAYHGKEGFLEFTHARTIYRSGWFDPRKALGLLPPYSPKTEARLRSFVKD